MEITPDIAPHLVTTGTWWTVSAWVTGCRVTPAEIDVLSRMRPTAVGMRGEVRDEGLLLTAVLEATSARAAQRRMRRAVQVLLDGFGAAVGDVHAVPDGIVPRQRARPAHRRLLGRSVGRAGQR